MSNFKKIIQITGGTSLQVIEAIGNQKNIGHVFFQPFQSKTDIALRATSIVTAPILSTSALLIAPLASTFFALKSLASLIFVGKAEAKEDIESAGAFFAVAMIALISTAVSALVNLIDFIGSFFTTLTKTSMNVNMTAIDRSHDIYDQQYSRNGPASTFVRDSAFSDLRGRDEGSDYPSMAYPMEYSKA